MQLLSAVSAPAAKTSGKILAMPRSLILTLIALTLFRYAYIIWGPLDLAPDEAHYWEWSRHLDIGYYSKGPVIAWIIALGTRIAGNTELGVRLFAPLISLAASLLAWQFANRLWDSVRAGVIAALLITLSPLFFVGGLVMTTDVPMVLCWLAALYATWQAVAQDTPRAWYAAGVFTGLGLLTKLSMGLLPVAVLLYLIWQPQLRYWLHRREPYLAALIALLCTLPMLWWNARHGWGTFLHANAHVEEGHASIGKWFEFLGGQIGIISPILFFMVTVGIWQFMRRPEPRAGYYGIILWPSLLSLLFFFGKATVGSVNANWPVATYTGLFILAAGPLSEVRFRRWLMTGFGLALLSLAIVLSTDLLRDLGLPIKRKQEASNQMRGWAQMAATVEKIRRSTGPAFLVTSTYQTASSLAFYLPDQPTVYNANFGGRRFNQYDFWPDFERHRGENALLIMDGIISEPPAIWQSRFDRCVSKGSHASVSQGIKWREYSVFFCENYHGGKWPRPASF